MLLATLVLIFVLIPTALVAATAALGPAGGRLVLYLGFPIGLLVFALVTFARSRPEDERS